MSRVVDLTAHSGAYGTRLLGEAGHNVVRVEPPQGDALRRLGPFLGETPDLERGACHQYLNAGKRSLAINLDSSSARELFLGLIRKSDALVANLPLPVEEKALLEANPNLVLTKVEDGEPELCSFARSGLLSLTGYPGKSPMLLGGHVIYAATGLYVATATAAALLVLQLTGRGQVVTVSIRQCLETLVEQAMVEYTLSGKGTERRGGRGGITPISGAIPCKDGYWVISQVFRSGRWQKFTEWVQDPDLIADPTLAEEESQHEKRDFIIDRINAWSQRFNKSELVEEAQRRHFPATPVSTPLDLVEDPQLIARGFIAEMDHPKFGRIMFPQGAVASILGTHVAPAPTVGQHNAEILAELGYSEAATQALRDSGAM